MDKEEIIKEISDSAKRVKKYRKSKKEKSCNIGRNIK